MMNVKEIAARCQKTEQTIRNYLKKTNVPQENGRYILTEDVINDVIAHYGGSDAPDQPETDENGEIIELLKSQLEAQKSEIELLRSWIEHYQEMLEQQQKLLDQQQQLSMISAQAKLPWFRRKKEIPAEQ